MTRMKSALVHLALLSAIVFMPVLVSVYQDSGVSTRARQVHDRAIVIDTHDDVTQRLVYEKTFDIGARNKTGSLDIPRMREGGLDALFFSIWITGDDTGPAAVKRALEQIDAVREAVRKHPNDFLLATTAADIRRAAE